ncbi:MAG: DUF2183 domain-containing protein [Archangiaceae bacterium]|nr:DUF2183 domain-containing protein [Archangiaceae bacterium]
MTRTVSKPPSAAVSRPTAPAKAEPPKAPAPAAPQRKADDFDGRPAEHPPKLGERVQMSFWKLVETVNNTAAKVLGEIREPVPLVFARHGIVAFDPKTMALEGSSGGAIVSNAPLKGLAPRGMATFHTLPMKDVKVSYQVGDGPWRASGQTDAGGFEPTSLDELSRDGLEGLDPKVGGLIRVNLEAEGEKSQQRILALPKDYDGPIFISDLNLTLRDVTTTGAALGKDYAPIPGTDTLLDAVATRRVPIVYLSGGFEAQGPWNERFISQYPDGPLLIRPSASMVEIGSNATADKNMGAYKASVVAQLKALFPKAQFIGFGDDKHEDPEVYTDAGFGKNVFIRNAYTPQVDVPAGFEGKVAATGEIDAAFRKSVLEAVDAAVARSSSMAGPRGGA